MQNKGFTLIELLVVVLIIGILASAALPQYRAAVLKARLARLIPAVRTIKNAAETYYMANGAYPDDSAVLDVGEISGCSTPGWGHIRCNDFWIDVKSRQQNTGQNQRQKLPCSCRFFVQSHGGQPG